MISLDGDRGRGCGSGDTNRLTMTAPSSMMQLDPIMMGPATAKMVALGWTTVPESADRRPTRELGPFVGGEETTRHSELT